MTFIPTSMCEYLLPLHILQSSRCVKSMHVAVAKGSCIYKPLYPWRKIIKEKMLCCKSSRQMLNQRPGVSPRVLASSRLLIRLSLSSSSLPARDRQTRDIPRKVNVSCESYSCWQLEHLHMHQVRANILSWHAAHKQKPFYGDLFPPRRSSAWLIQTSSLPILS
jgi:hypothetical protein